MRILIVDDHPIVIAGCRMLLASLPDVQIFEALEATTAIETYFTQRPDVVVLDISLPGLSGLEVIRRILERDAEAKIMVFTLNTEASFAARAIETGARGFFGKDDDPAYLPGAVAKLAAGGTYLSSELAQQIAFQKLTRDASPLAQLSTRESEVLQLLKSGATTREIAKLAGLSSKTVANACTSLKRKLGARTSGDLVRIAVEGSL